MNAKTDLSLRQFMESTWFVLAARGFAIAGGILATVIAPAVGSYMLWIGARVSTIENARAMETQVYSQQIETIKDRTVVLAQNMDEIKTVLNSIRVDMATTKGILSEIQRRDDVAALAGRPYDRPSQ